MLGLALFSGCTNNATPDEKEEIANTDNVETTQIEKLNGADLNAFLEDYAGLYCDLRLMSNEFWIEYYSPSYRKIVEERGTDIPVMNMLGEVMLNKLKINDVEARREAIKSNPIANEFIESIRLLELAFDFQYEYFSKSSTLLNFDEFMTSAMPKQLAFAETIKEIQPMILDEHDVVIGKYENLFSIESIFIYTLEDNCGEVVWTELAKQEGQKYDASVTTRENQESSNADQAEVEAFISVPDVSTLSRSDNNAYYVYGATSVNCSKVIVEAKNTTANIYDKYELSTYTQGDTSFKYGIREDWNNLGEGSNEYTFTAYCGGDQSLSETLVLNYEASVPQTPTTTSYDYSPPPTSLPTSTNYAINTDDINYLYTNEADIFVECDDDYVYLGKIGGKYDSDSIFSKYGDYGSKYGDTIWAKYSDYGSKYSDCSPYDQYTSNPPMIYINDSLVGYLSKNKYAGTNVIDPDDLLLFAYQKWDDDHWLDLMQD
jgi:hypothetical protein